MTSNSFQFGGYNSVDDWGIKVLAYDTLIPPKRMRRQQIPGRNGSYDYGTKNYDDRLLRLSCTLERKISKAQLREIAYLLSQKSQLRLWNEEDKYYIGELDNAAEVTDYPCEAMREFELTFTCEPFAYGAMKEIDVQRGINPLTYAGTAETPFILRLSNRGNNNISNITITVVKRQ